MNKSRIPVISKYILDNRETYVFSALAVSIDDEFVFKSDSINPDVGTLEVSMDDKFLINDGQHRKSSILEAMREDSSLGERKHYLLFSMPISGWQEVSRFSSNLLTLNTFYAANKTIVGRKIEKGTEELLQIKKQHC